MSMEVLSRHWEELRNKPHYLNSAVATKITDGKDTGVPAIVIYVSKKVPLVELAAEHLIPKEIEGIATDVVELAPKTWQAGETAISRLHPEEQLRRLGLSKGSYPKAKMIRLNNPGTPSGASDWIAKANKIQDQRNCGACVVFDATGVWETKYNLTYGILIKLSEGHLFYCTPGANCEDGTTPEDVLTQAMQGVCLEDCLPYVDQDQACESGICSDWQAKAKKLTGYNAIDDPTQIMVLLDSEPLAATMQVPQSFLNYVSGVYQRQGDTDPFVGGHGIGCLGYNMTFVFNGVTYNVRFIRNSWTEDWAPGCVINGVARPGYAIVTAETLDPVMYQLLITDAPVPGPAPVPPSSKCCLARFFKKKAA